MFKSPAELRSRLIKILEGVIENTDQGVFVSSSNLLSALPATAKLKTKKLIVIVLDMSANDDYNSSSWQKHSDRTWTVTLVDLCGDSELFTKARDKIAAGLEVRRQFPIPQVGAVPRQIRFEVFESGMINVIR